MVVVLRQCLPKNVKLILLNGLYHVFVIACVEEEASAFACAMFGQHQIEFIEESVAKRVHPDRLDIGVIRDAVLAPYTLEDIRSEVFELAHIKLIRVDRFDFDFIVEFEIVFAESVVLVNGDYV